MALWILLALLGLGVAPPPATAHVYDEGRMRWAGTAQKLEAEA